MIDISSSSPKGEDDISIYLDETYDITQVRGVLHTTTIDDIQNNRVTSCWIAAEMKSV